MNEGEKTQQTVNGYAMLVIIFLICCHKYV